MFLAKAVYISGISVKTPQQMFLAKAVYIPGISLKHHRKCF
jgi:hypothetical protein